MIIAWAAQAEPGFHFIFATEFFATISIIIEKSQETIL